MFLNGFQYSRTPHTHTSTQSACHSQSKSRQFIWATQVPNKAKTQFLRSIHTERWMQFSTCRSLCLFLQCAPRQVLIVHVAEFASFVLPCAFLLCTTSQLYEREWRRDPGKEGLGGREDWRKAGRYASKVRQAGTDARGGWGWKTASDRERERERERARK